jgi:hypothetical protein
LPHSYVYDSDQGPLYLTLGETGVTQTATADFVTDGTNLARTIAAEPRQYAKVAIYEGLGKGIGGALFGGFGFVAKSVAGKITSWGVEKLGDWFGAQQNSLRAGKGEAGSDIFPSGGSQDSAYVVGFFLADGSLVISNGGAAVTVSNVLESISAVLPGSSELSVSGTTGTLSSPRSLPVPDSTSTVPITITPTDGSTVPTLWPCIVLGYPNDAIATHPSVDLSSLTCRVNGQLVSTEMFPGAYSTTFAGTILTSTWCAPANRPFREGANTIRAGITTFGGQRAIASATVNAQWSAPRAPQNLLAYAGRTRILLAWDQSSEPSVVGYRIYRGSTQIGQSVLPRWLVGVADSLSGDYTVTAVDASNRESSASAVAPAELSASNSLPAPTEPAALQANAGDSVVDLHVESSASGNLGWRFERATGAGGPFSVLAGLTDVDYVDESVINGTSYWYRAVPIGYDGAEGDGVEVGPVTAANAAPGQPTGVTVELSGNGALIEWNPSPEKDLAGYRVYRRALGTAGWELQNSTLLDSPSFLNTIQYSTLYAWAVAAVDATGLESTRSGPETGGAFGTTAPSVTGVTPAVGPVAGGTIITVTGTAFVVGQTTVMVGGLAATDVTVVDAGTITATTPAHLAGTVDVVVWTVNSQTGTLTSGFRYGGYPCSPTIHWRREPRR